MKLSTKYTKAQAAHTLVEVTQATEVLLKKSYGFVSWLIGLSFTALLLPFNATGMATSKAKTKTVKAANPDEDAHTIRVSASGKNNKRSATEASLGSDMVTFARQFLGRPYRSAAKGPSAFDCSGFTGYIYKRFGHILPSCSQLQSTIGHNVSVDQAQPGDLVFFGRKGKKGTISIYHAGIVASAKGEALKVIHAASRLGVTITDLSKAGYWKSNLVSIRRVVKNPALATDSSMAIAYLYK